MGQYFMAVNKTKQEYVASWDMGGDGKLWEWCADKVAGIFPFLLCKSKHYLLCAGDEAGAAEADLPAAQYLGRWAGDEVYLVGDFDNRALFDQAHTHYHNIAQGLVAEYNQFMDDAERELCYTPLL